MATVEVALYDLSRGMASLMSHQILGQRIDGIWHTGVVVFGIEYFFGGGIQKLPHGIFAAQNGMECVQMLNMGTTTKTRSELDAYLVTIHGQFNMNTYDLINNNCNNFSDVICRFLVGNGIPTHIVDLPRIIFSTPGGMMLRPYFESMSQSVAGTTHNYQNNLPTRTPFNCNNNYNNNNVTTATSSTGMNIASTQPFESTLSHNMMSVMNSLDQHRLSTNEIISSELPNTYLHHHPHSSSSSSSSSSSTTVVHHQDSHSTCGSITCPNDEKQLHKLLDYLFLSAESSNIEILMNKILNYSDQSIFQTSEEKQALMELLPLLKDSKYETATLPEHSVVIGRICKEVPALLVPCLFIIRLMALFKYHPCSFKPVICQMMQRACTPNGFPSTATRVMGLSVLVNYTSHKPGIQHCLSACWKFKFVIDLVTSGLTHNDLSTRLISASLACNIAILCSKDDTNNTLENTDNISTTCNDSTTSTNIWPPIWNAQYRKLHRPDTNIEELPCQAVQLFVCVLETLPDETNVTLRFRKLLIMSRILTYCGIGAVTLSEDLGFTAMLHDWLHTKSDIPFTHDEMLLIKHAYTTIQKNRPLVHS